MSTFRENSPILIQSFYRISTEQFDPFVGKFSRGLGIYDFANLSKKSFLFMRHEYGKTEGDDNHLLIQVFKWHKELPSDISSVLSYYNDIQKNEGCDINPKYKKALLSLGEELDEFAISVLRTIQWKTGVLFPVSEVYSSIHSLRWSHEPPRKDVEYLDELGFLPNPFPKGWERWPYFRTLHDVLKEDEFQFIQNLVNDSQIEPVYHDIFREAWINRNSSLRSSLVVGFTALETGFKTTFSELVPEWGEKLLSLQSPPIFVLIKDWIGVLPVKNKFEEKVLRPGKKHRGIIRKMTEARNQVVHGRKHKVDPDELQEWLLTIRSILYLFDYYRGNGWALRMISKDFIDGMECAV